MKQGHFEEHWTDENGNPAGGVSSGTGFTVSWQNGPLGRHSDECLAETEREKSMVGCDHTCFDACTRRAPNGAFVEDVLEAVAGRIEFYQASRFSCDANEDALKHITFALACLNGRTKDREHRKVEGVHEA